MKIKYLVFLFILIGCMEVKAQSTVIASVNASGWKRIGYTNVGNGRGFGKISLFTTGGSTTPNHIDIEWFKDWKDNGGISVKSNSQAGFWSAARLTFSNDTTFIEVNFNRELSNFNIMVDSYGWNVSKLYSGFLPNGGGLVKAEAKAGQMSLNDQFFVGYNGFVGIGTNTPKELLSVNGNIRARQVKVETSNWPDYVFKDDYNLPSLADTEEFIKTNGHLPEIPKAETIEKEGYSLNEMDKILLKKIEEMTLHLIRLDKENKELKELILRQKNISF